MTDSPSPMFSSRATVAADPAHVWSLLVDLERWPGWDPNELQPVGDGTDVDVREVFRGPLAPMITRSIPDLQPSFDAFVAGLADAMGPTR